MQANLGAVPPAPEKANWHEQTGVGEEDEEDLEELPPEAFMDSDESADEDFLDDLDFYSCWTSRGCSRMSEAAVTAPWGPPASMRQPS